MPPTSEYEQQAQYFLANIMPVAMASLPMPVFLIEAILFSLSLMAF